MSARERLLLVTGALLVANWIAAAVASAPNATLAAPADLDTLARRHVPAIYQDPALPGGPLRAMLYEAYAEGPRVSILYRTVWDDEIHPVPWLHAVYRPFRQLWYGSARDVEYVRVDVDRASGEVVALDFQTEASGRADATFPRHERVVLERPRSLALRVLTWNHLLAPADEGAAGRNLVRARPALRAATAADRAELRLRRRTYAYLEPFGPVPLHREAPIFALAALGALCVRVPRGRAAKFR